MHSILEHCGPSPLRILGTLNHRNAWDLDSPQLFAFTIASSGTVNIQCDVKGQNGVQIISYQRPDPSRMQFMSLRPISLSIQEKAERIGLEIPPFEGIDAAERAEEKKLEQLVEKLKLHTVKTYEPTQKDEALPQLISQVNCSYDINAVLQQNVGLVRPRARRRALSVGERVVESANDLWDYTLMALWYIWTVWLFPIATKCLILAIMAHRIFGEAVMSTAHRPVGPRKTALTDISATAQQVDLRLQQFCYWPIQYLTLKERKKQWECISTNHSEYIRFYNSLWLVANDVIMGIAIGTYIIENADSVASHADKVLGLWSLEGLRRSISWLMVYPGGLKLNNELARFLGDLFLWVIDYWGGELYLFSPLFRELTCTGCVATLQPHLPHIFRFIGFASFAGATMPLSLTSDLLSLCTLHIYCFYIASARIYGWQLTIITSLFHLFRGKKRNVLRNRIDSCDYELDQLLLGTILFTLLFFLLPTVMVFYMTFALARMAIICLKAILDTLLACLNHFPLFALMLRVKDPFRLPGKHHLFRLSPSRPRYPQRPQTSNSATRQRPTSPSK